MNHFTKALSVLTVGMFMVNGLFAQANFFQTIPPSNDLPKAVEATNSVKKLGIVRLNETGLRNYLLSAPLEFQNNGVTLPLQIPLPNGKTETFGIVESPILSPAVAAQHPEIKTYTGNGLTNKKMVIRLSLTSNGFNAILLNTDGGDAVYFEKYSNEDPDLYFNYFAKDATVPSGYSKFSCSVGADIENVLPKGPGLGNEKSTGETLRTFRLAMAANGEFTEHNGGSVGSAFSAIVDYVNRMDAVYRTELSVSFVLVTGTEIIYDDATTDPYTNSDQDAMLEENQINLDNIVGSDNYDIGHVWGFAGSSGGGIASLASVCDSAIKGEGVSGEGEDPWTQVFFDQLILHEVGHQFGMTHSYNSNIPVCTTRRQETSVEPGSGATIMSYGFTCDADDYLESTTEGPILYFHTVNFSQAEAYMNNPDPGFGNCYDPTSTNNSPPIVTVPPGFIIPISTPFSLTGTATDPDGDALTYAWEGTNVGTIEIPDETVLTDDTKPPFFRSYEPSDSPTRTYPTLDSILNNANVARGDKLPSIGFVTTHRLTVRDNYFGGGGVAFDTVTVTVDGNIGPFLETTNLSDTYLGFSTQTITWSVNGTDAATPQINILLSLDGGYTFTTLLTGSDNDGVQDVTLPNTPTSAARIKVEAVGNIFFDISNADFTIEEAVDADGDGFHVGQDCDDTNANSYPGATEICDGEDNDCDTSIPADELDGDDDGYSACEGDCDDADDTFAPDAPELCDALDNDCDGNVPANELDDDGDGYAACQNDCDDTDAAINPDATEVCDGLDNNCDGTVDEGVTTLYFADADSDGFGDAAVSEASCMSVAGYVTDDMDCDDTNDTINPDATEVCDNVDNNCDAAIDEGFTTSYYPDVDGDGFGAINVWVMSCAPVPGYVTVSGDCDDDNADTYPAATEICDGLDNDCDGDTPADELDEDNDTYSVCEGDCDDTDATFAPNAPELCDGLDNDCDGAIPGEVDDDNDSFTICEGDCDDTDDAINPGATEACDGVDNNCDGATDEDFVVNYYPDLDLDGFGNAAGLVVSCTPVPDFVDNDDDCDDTDADINPDATEVCDNVDNNCDGATDEGLTVTYYPDLDLDGFGDEASGIASCTPVTDYITIGGDCDDANADINPDATEVCDGIDNDCDAVTDEGLLVAYYPDLDLDGFGDETGAIASCTPVADYVTVGDDCDDANADINPDATEVCDNVDNDCNDIIDDGLTSAYYEDADGDGFGTPLVWVFSCTPVAGYVTNSTDCDDANADINIAEPEVCDGIDNNCNVAIDEGVTTAYYEDADGDGFGTPLVWVFTCAPVAGYVTNSTDCNDANADINITATEVCDGVDNDCDFLTDEGFVVNYYPDLDLDGFGDAAGEVVSCTPVPDFVENDDDCDDTNGDINPAATELCNGTDDDCDSSTDEGLTATFYADADGDGFGDAAVSEEACSANAGFVADGTDCDDTDAAINTDATEACDGVDNNCDGSVDDGLTLATYYADADGDGFGDADVSMDTCVQLPGFVTNSNDCDDTNALTYPGINEICDGKDNDCDDIVPIDEIDGDGDGLSACLGDCDDTDATVFPGVPELCDGLDNDCDDVVPANEMDADGDGLSACSGDCDDTDDTVAPGLAELCDGLDNNCDGAMAANEVDGDNDGFMVCENDCDDANAAIHPGAAEVCDGLDSNCDNNIPLNEQDSDGDDFFACNGDCNETNATVFPNAPELCDGLDNDCDGNIMAIEADADDDGFMVCEDDCNDANASVHPGAPEVCDGLDNNCDGTFPANEVDGDSDGFLVCEDDCNDANANINPGATEIANNGIDEDCDGADLISGVAEPSLEQLLLVAPNPFSTSLKLSCDCTANLNYSLYDQLGRTLQQGAAAMNHGTVEIKTPDLTPGMYYLSITDEAGKTYFVKRLVNIK